MNIISVTELRSNLYKIIDEIILTGHSQEINRNGHILKIILDENKKVNSKFKNLKCHNTIIGDPENLINVKTAKWHKEDNI